MRVLAMPDRLLDLPAPPGGLAVVLEVRGRQLGRVDIAECGVRGTPRLPLRGGAGLVERESMTWLTNVSL